MLLLRRPCSPALVRPSSTAAAVAALLVLAGCGAADPPATDPTASPAPASSPAATPAPSAASTSSSTTGTGPVTTLASEPFSGYVDVEQEVLGWRLTCPPDFEEVVPQAVTMGTATADLPGGEGTVARQVAVFASVEGAVTAADLLGTLARESCEGEYEPQPGFVASTSTVQDLDVGSQGFLVDTTAEDGDSAVAVLRRGNSIALVQAAALPPYPGGRTPAQDVRDGAADVFAQLCEYEQDGC